MIIYRLSPLLGGRSEVLKLTLMEALGHMCLLKDKDEIERKEKEYERYLHFLSMFHSHPIDSDNTEAKRAREEFFEMIKPKQENQLAPPTKEYKWDYEK